MSEFRRESANAQYRLQRRRGADVRLLWHADRLGNRLLRALRAALDDDREEDEALLQEYGTLEAAAEAGLWLPYREVLTRSLSEVCRGRGVVPSDAQKHAFGSSVLDWPAFPDSAAALAKLRERFDLGVITNCDDDLFAHSNALLGEPFRWIVTAEQLHSYKPNPRTLELDLARIGRPCERVVHVAQSLFRDHVPAETMGLRTVWINRRHGRPGSGATPPRDAQPDMTFNDMASFAAATKGRQAWKPTPASRHNVPSFAKRDGGSMVRASRLLYMGTAWVFVIGLTAQVFFIGLGIFSSPSATELPRNFGWILHLFPLVIVLFAYLSRGGRIYWGSALILALVVFVVPLLATARGSAPLIAALHPVGAVIAYAIAVIVAIGAYRLAQKRDAAVQPR